MPSFVQTAGGIFVSDVYAVRERQMAAGAVNATGDADAAEEGGMQGGMQGGRDSLEMIRRAVWQTRMPKRDDMHTAGAMALLRALSRADERTGDGEPIGPCAYLAAKLPDAAQEVENYYGSAAQCRLLADLAEEE